MSAHSDAKKALACAVRQGCEVIKGKHGGYGVYIDGELVTRIPASGNGSPHWLKRVRRDLAPFGVVV